MNSSILSRLFQWRNSAPARRKLQRFLPETAEALEFRVMLDGNVTAIVADGHLNITGDAAGNSVEVTVVDGDVVVRGLESTTINGSSNPFIAFADTTRITGNAIINLASGNDLVAFSNSVTVGGDLSIFDLRGTNQIGILNTTISGNLSIHTGRASDEVLLSLATITGDARIVTGQGADTVSLLETTIGGNTVVNTGQDNDVIVTETSELDGNVWLKTGQGQDDVIFTSSTVAGNLHGNAGQGNDLVMFDGSTVTGRTSLWTLQGNDTVLTQNTNTFTGQFFAGGILGKSDTFQASDATTFTGGNRAVGFENATVNATTLNTRLNAATTGAITRSSAIRTTFGNLLVGNFNLTAAIAADPNVVDSNGIPLTKDQTITVTGTTLANGTVKVDADNDGAFDDGTAVANSSGAYSLEVTLGAGAQNLRYQVTDSTGRATTMTAQTSVYQAVGTVIQFDSSMGTFDVELLDQAAPITVANFLTYLDDYTNSIVHRSPGTFVVQGGGFTVTNDVVARIETPATGIQNEFNAANSNVAGTLSMALQPGLPNSGTSGWFFNAVNNTSLNAAQHTVFGRLIGNSLGIITAIDAIPTFTIASAAGAIADIPLVNFTPTTVLTGTFSVVAGETTVTGTGTQFSTQLAVGQQIQLGDQLVTIASIESNTGLTLSAVHVNGATNASVTVTNQPTDENFVIFTSISEILT